MAKDILGQVIEAFTPKIFGNMTREPTHGLRKPILVVDLGPMQLGFLQQARDTLARVKTPVAAGRETFGSMTQLRTRGRKKPISAALPDIQQLG